MMQRTFIPLGKPSITESDIEAVARVLRSGMLIQGENVLSLENIFATQARTKAAVAVSNGTATLHLALKVLGIGPGDEVIVPAFSYVATANVVELVGARPVFVDIEPSTFNIDAGKIAPAITGKTKAIIPVHEFGLACDIETICSMASANKLYVIEDAACALGAMQRNRPVGSFGIAGSFSLHPRKSVTSGEGGVLVTNDEKLEQQFRRMRNHGIETRAGIMHFPDAGFNYRMTDFQAALALGQLKRLDQIIARKQILASLYFSQIKNPAITLPAIPGDRNHSWQTFHVMLDKKYNQGEVIRLLKEKGIGANYGAQCIPAQEYYQHKYKLNVPELFPHAYKAYTRGLAIPLYDLLTEEEVLYISATLNQL